MRGLWLLRDWVREYEKGATAVEYAIMVALIAVVVVAAVTALGLGVAALLEPAGGALSP